MAEYVLPTFEVQIDSSDEFTLEDESVRAIIRAKYTDGKALRGTATVAIIEESYEYDRSASQSDESDEPLAAKTIALDGRGLIEFDIKNELKLDRNELSEFFYSRDFIVMTEVTETLTGLSQSAVKLITIHKDSYDINIDYSYVGPKRDRKINVTVSLVEL